MDNTVSAGVQDKDLVQLENSHLRIAVLPRRGGKIISLFNKINNTEWLSPPARSGSETKDRKVFDADEAFGFDEMFPTIVPETIRDAEGDEIVLPDHGEVWSAGWQVRGRSSDSLDLSVKGDLFPYEFRRTAVLRGNRLILRYRVRNLAGFSAAALWTPHPLFSFFAETEILVPREMSAILQAMDEGPLGRYGTKHSLGNKGFIQGAGSLFLPGTLPLNSAFKFYGAAPLQEGFCGLKDRRGSLSIKYPADCIPWLGFWINNGGWGKQHNLALEPATAPMDSPGAAEALGVPAFWRPGEEKSWELIFEIN